MPRRVRTRDHFCARCLVHVDLFHRHSGHGLRNASATQRAGSCGTISSWCRRNSWRTCLRHWCSKSNTESNSRAPYRIGTACETPRACGAKRRRPFLNTAFTKSNKAEGNNQGADPKRNQCRFSIRFNCPSQP